MRARRLFLFNSIHKVDKKGRVSIPATFRRVLEEEEMPGVVIGPSLGDVASLDGSGYSRIEDMAARIATLNQLDPGYQALSNLVLARSQHLPVDSDGRIVLPEPLLAAARIEDRALFAGLGQFFQIWNPVIYESQQETFQRLAKENFHRLPATLPPPDGAPPPPDQAR